MNTAALRLRPGELRPQNQPSACGRWGQGIKTPAPSLLSAADSGLSETLWAQLRVPTGVPAW